MGAGCPLHRHARDARAVIYDFTKAADVVAWYRIAPKRHGQQLKWLAEFRPQYREAIKEAGRLLRG